MVFERHHSSRICLIPLALETPKLWERFSLGLDSLALLSRNTLTVKHDPITWNTRSGTRLILDGLRVHSLEHGPPGLGTTGAGWHLRSGHILLKLRPRPRPGWFPARESYQEVDGANGPSWVWHIFDGSKLTFPNWARIQIWLLISRAAIFLQSQRKHSVGHPRLSSTVKLKCCEEFLPAGCGKLTLLFRIGLGLFRTGTVWGTCQAVEFFFFFLKKKTNESGE